MHIQGSHLCSPLLASQVQHPMPHLASSSLSAHILSERTLRVLAYHVCRDLFRVWGACRGGPSFAPARPGASDSFGRPGSTRRTNHINDMYPSPVRTVRGHYANVNPCSPSATAAIRPCHSSRSPTLAPCLEPTRGSTDRPHLAHYVSTVWGTRGVWRNQEVDRLAVNRGMNYIVPVFFCGWAQYTKIS